MKLERPLDTPLIRTRRLGDLCHVSVTSAFCVPQQIDKYQRIDNLRVDVNSRQNLPVPPTVFPRYPTLCAPHSVMARDSQTATSAATSASLSKIPWQIYILSLVTRWHRVRLHNGVFSVSVPHTGGGLIFASPVLPEYLSMDFPEAETPSGTIDPPCNCYCDSLFLSISLFFSSHGDR